MRREPPLSVPRSGGGVRGGRTPEIDEPEALHTQLPTPRDHPEAHAGRNLRADRGAPDGPATKKRLGAPAPSRSMTRESVDPPPHRRRPTGHPRQDAISQRDEMTMHSHPRQREQRGSLARHRGPQRAKSRQARRAMSKMRTRLLNLPWARSSVRERHHRPGPTLAQTTAHHRDHDLVELALRPIQRPQHIRLPHPQRTRRPSPTDPFPPHKPKDQLLPLIQLAQAIRDKPAIRRRDRHLLNALDPIVNQR